MSKQSSPYERNQFIEVNLDRVSNSGKLSFGTISVSMDNSTCLQ